MRLSERSRVVIRETVREVFGKDASVRLFGSRAENEALGGDIDLLVELPCPVEEREHKILKLIARLQIQLGDQPIDVLVLDPETERKPIHEQALQTGVLL